MAGTERVFDMGAYGREDAVGIRGARRLKDERSCVGGKIVSQTNGEAERPGQAGDEVRIDSQFAPGEIPLACRHAESVDQIAFRSAEGKAGGVEPFVKAIGHDDGAARVASGLN